MIAKAHQWVHRARMSGSRRMHWNDLGTALSARTEQESQSTLTTNKQYGTVKAKTKNPS
jgi:hypothetical protein